MPDHADTPRDRQIVTSRHGQPDLAPSPNVTRHKIRARAIGGERVCDSRNPARWCRAGLWCSWCRLDAHSADMTSLMAARAADWSTIFLAAAYRDRQFRPAEPHPVRLVAAGDVHDDIARFAMALTGRDRLIGHLARLRRTGSRYRWWRPGNDMTHDIRRSGWLPTSLHWGRPVAHNRVFCAPRPEQSQVPRLGAGRSCRPIASARVNGTLAQSGAPARGLPGLGMELPGSLAAADGAGLLACPVLQARAVDLGHGRRGDGDAR